MLEILQEKVFPGATEGGRRDSREVGLDVKLLSALVRVGLDCYGFSERQKAMIVDLVGPSKDTEMFSNYGRVWPFNTLVPPKGVADQDVGMWLDLFAGGVSAMQRKGQTLCIGNVLVVGAKIGGELEILVTQDGLTRSFIDISAMEKRLVHIMIQNGWDAWFSARGMPTYSPIPFVDAEAGVQRKMHQLGVFNNGIQPPKEENKFHFPKLAELLAAQKAKREQQVVARPEDVPTTGTEGVSCSGTSHAAMMSEVPTTPPPLTRAPSFSSDSGLQGMHLIKQARPDLSDLSMLTLEVATTDIEENASIAAESISHDETLPEVIRGRSSTVIVKRRGEQDASEDVIAFRGRAQSQSKETYQHDPFVTSSRRHSTKSSDSGNISPRTVNKTSPSKSFIIGGAGSEYGTPLPPVGTPSRRSLPKNTVEIHQALDEAPELGEEMRAAVDRARREENPGRHA